MIIAKRSLIFSILLVGLLGVAEVVSTKKGKGRRLQQRPFAPAYHNVPFSQSRIPSYHTLPSGYPTPPALRQPPARPVAPRPGIVVFGVGPNSLQIPNHYTNYAGAPQQTKPIVIPAPAYAPPTAAVTRTPPRNQPAVSNYAKPVHNQQNVEQTRYHPQPIQPTYPVQSPQYGNRFPVVQPENYQQPSAQVVAVPAPIPVIKPQVNIPTYVAPAKSTVYGSAYVANSASYPASDSYTRGEASKPVGSVPAPYQSPVQQPQENYGTTPTVSYTSKPTAIYIGTKSEQSIGNYGIEAPKIKESQSSYSPLSHHQIKYSTDVPYSTIESKPTSDSNEKSNAAKHQDKKPVYPTPQSYKETESLSYGEKKKETESSTLSYSKVEAKPMSQPSKLNENKESSQEETKVKVHAYPSVQSHKKVEYQEEKKEQVSVYATNLPPTKSESTSEDKSYQSHTQTEKSFANKKKSQSSVYTTSPSYKEVDSQSYGEQKKKVDESSLSYSAVASKPVIESSKKNDYQPATEDKVKVPTYSASQDYKEVDSSKDVYDYKKQEATVYQPISVSGSYVKNSDSYEEENQPKKPVVPTPSYKTVESLPKAEDEKKHYEAEQIPSKPASVSSYETYSSNSAVRQEQSKDHESNSKSYESKYTSVYQAPVKEENAYSKQLSDKSNIDSLPVYSTSTSSPSYQYSTGYKLTTKVPVIPIEDKVKVPSYFPSKTYKEVEAPKDVHDYKKQESAVYKHTPVSDSYVKHSASYVEESQHQKTVVSTSSSYKKNESVPNSEYKQKHYEAENVPSKAADVPTNEKYPSTLLVTQEQSKYHESNSKNYESKSVSPATKSPVKEINIYSKPTSDESNRYSLPVYSTTTSLPSYQYSTESTTTSKVPIIPIEDNVKVSAYSASQTCKEVESPKDIQHYKKQDSAVYQHKPVSDSYVKHSASYVEESQPQKTVVSTSSSYKKEESLTNSEYKQKHYEAEHVPSKAADVLTNEKYPSTLLVTQEQSKYHESNSKTYESKYLSVSPATKTPVKEINIYSKPTSDESNRYSLPVYSTTTSLPSYQYSTESTTTRKVPIILIEDNVKVPAYSASQTYKEVESPKDIQHYKKPDSAVYEHTPISDSYVKHSVSNVEESQPKKTVVSNSPSYKKDEPSPNFEYKQKHYEAEHGSSKADPVPAYEKYPSTSAVTQESPKYHESNSKTYESKYPSVSPTTKAPVKEVNAYSKPKSDDSSRYSLPVYSTTTLSPSYQYSTSYTTTTKAPAISYDEKTKAYYTTTPKYQEYSTSGSAVTRNPPAYQSTVAYENIPVAKTPTPKEDNKNQYSTKKDTDIKAGAPAAVEKSYATPTTTANYDVKANDRVYVVDNRDEIVETYQKKEPVSSYQSYPNPSVDGKLSSVKQVVNQYGSTDRGYNSASSDTANKSSYEGRPASSSAVDLPTYNRKPNQDSLTTSVEGAKDSGSYGNDGVEGDYSAIPGKPEIDYPIFSELPNNKFNCSEQRLPGYYADTSARCQVFHICLGDRQWSFLCPNGTIFSQRHFVCVWWYEFDCSKATALYELNANLFIIPSTERTPDFKGEQREKPFASETSEETGKRYDELTNKNETISGSY